MKKLFFIVLGASALVFILFACHNDKTNKIENITYEKSVVSVVNVDGLNDKRIPVQLGRNERILASFINDDYTCELLVGYITPKYNVVSNFSHRKIIVTGKSGHWDRKKQTTFVFNNGKQANIVPIYQTNEILPMAKQPLNDNPLEIAEELPMMVN